MEHFNFCWNINDMNYKRTNGHFTSSLSTPPVISLSLLMLCTVVCCSSTQSRVETVENYRQAKKSGDFDLARSLLSEKPRVWYEKREGDGIPIVLGNEKYGEWDRHFRSKGEIGVWTVEENSVWAIATEDNDYFRLIERETVSQYRITYFFDSSGKIEGYMISAAYPDRPNSPSISRFDEVEAWALANHAEEWEYLRPGGKLDPTGDRAQRTRKLINLWRLEVGLKPIE